ncbi:MAG: hypothetical protein H0V17_04390 [Deltaproteobacteria bacterium]|nr:hypothetical protein [Deltaproteobacteria bacterium]
MITAVANAKSIREGTAVSPPVPVTVKRRVAIGDPQSSTLRFLSALHAHGLLGDDGWLRPDVRLIAMGDYFDYRVSEREQGRVEGVLILGWLAAHAPEHVTIVFGNHDAARVMEFAEITDERFREAAEVAAPIVALPRADRPKAEAEFLRAFPGIPTPGYAARDFNAFTVEQRELVQRMLLADRFTLATTASVLGTPVLMTHAGITKRELGYLCARDHKVDTIAEMLQLRLAGAVRTVADAWRAGTPMAMSLEPLHVAAHDGEEGGGLLYHRPADPDRPGADASWEQSGRAPRKYDPRAALPRGLAQVVGHTGHRKAAKEMPRWRADDCDDAPGGVRTLRITHDGVATYRRGAHKAEPRDAVLYMIDPEMHYVATPADVAILELDV